MLRDRSLRAKEPSSRDWKRVGSMKAPSVVGRNWWIWIVFAASRSCFAGRERRRASFSFADRVSGIERAFRSWSNWGWVSVGFLGCTAGELE